MKKYIIAIYSNFEGTNKHFVVTAEDAVDAAKKAIIEDCTPEYRSKDFLDWVAGLGDDLESVLVGAIQSELVLTEPYCLFS